MFKVYFFHDNLKQGVIYQYKKLDFDFLMNFIICLLVKNIHNYFLFIHFLFQLTILFKLIINFLYFD
jgi:hypothetical protein